MSEIDERLDYLKGSIERLEEHVELLQERCRQQDELIAVLFLAVRPPEMQDTVKGSKAKFKRVLNGDSVLRWHISTYEVHPVFGDEP